MIPETMTQAQTKTQAAEPNTVERQALLMLLTLIALFISAQAAYATPTPMGAVLCAIVDMVYGNLGRGIATLAVVIIGVGATLGKTSWGLAMTVAVGISVIFNAGIIVGYLGSGAAGCI